MLFHITFLRVNCTLKPILLIFMVALDLQPDILKNTKGKFQLPFCKAQGY